MRWNSETQICCAVLAMYVAVLVYSITHKTVSPLLWLIRGSLLVVTAYQAYALGKNIHLGYDAGITESLWWLAGMAVVLGLSFLKLPNWLIWTSYSMLLLVVIAATCFAAFFTIRMM